MAAATLRTSQNTSPQLENLKEAKDLKSAVYPRSVDIYSYKTPDWVQRPMGGPNSMTQLAAALSSFNPILNKMAAVQEERFFEEQTAEGMKLQHSLEDNAKSWEEFIKDNPEYAGLNPHLERGFKAAQLNTKAQEYAAAREKFYTDKNLSAIEDPEEVKRILAEFDTDFINTNVLPLGADGKLYVNNFLPAVQRAEGSLLERYTKDRANINLAKSESATEENILTTVDTMRLEGASQEQIAAKLGEIMQTMSSPMAGSMPYPKIKEILTKSILQMAAAEGFDGDGEDILELADKIKTGTGTLGGTPEFKAAARAMKDKWKQQVRSRRMENLQLENESRRRAEYAAKEVVGKEFIDAYLNGKPLPEPAVLMSLPGVKPEHLHVISDVSNSFRSATTHRPVDDLKTQSEYMEDYNKARLGELHPAATLGFPDKYTIDKAIHLYNTAAAAQDSESPGNKALSSSGFQEARKTLAAQIKAQIEPTGIKSPDVIAARINEAEGFLIDEVLAYVGEKKGVYDGAALRIFARQKALEIGKDPFIRDFESLRNIRNPSDSNSNEPVTKPVTQQFRSEDEAGDVITTYLMDRDKARTTLSKHYNLTPEQVDQFIVDQLEAYGLDEDGLARLAKERLLEQEQLKQTVWGLQEPVEKESKYAKYRRKR